MSEDCFYEEGKQAFFENLELSECPYEEDTDGQFGWAKGWRAAQKEYELQTGDNAAGKI